MIVGVALKKRNTTSGSELVISLLEPNRHHDVIQKIVDDLEIERVIGTEWIQGFITDNGTFLDRKQAAEYALANKQINESVDILFSEDLW